MKNTEKKRCISCGKSDLSKDEIGINMKLIGAETQNFYCIDCLSDVLGVSVVDIYEKIEEFKEEGCTLFS